MRLSSFRLVCYTDRDVNAARNVLAAGLAVSVCGESGSPVLLQSDNGGSL